MKYCGQNVFCYPGVWYKGLIGEDYNPRSHAPDFLSAWYEKFDKEGLFFVPNVNANNMEIPAGLVTMDTMTNGALHASPIAIHDTGKPNWGGWHNSPPNFNFFHPDVQAQIERHVDALLGQGAAHPSFKGVCMYLTMHSMKRLQRLRRAGVRQGSRTRHPHRRTRPAARQGERQVDTRKRARRLGAVAVRPGDGVLRAHGGEAARAPSRLEAVAEQLRAAGLELARLHEGRLHGTPGARGRA